MDESIDWFAPYLFGVIILLICFGAFCFSFIFWYCVFLSFGQCLFGSSSDKGSVAFDLIFRFIDWFMVGLLLS